MDSTQGSSSEASELYDAQTHLYKLIFNFPLLCNFTLQKQVASKGSFASTKVLLQDKKLEEEEEAYALTPSSKLLLKGNKDQPCLSLLVQESLMPTLTNMWHSSKNWIHGKEEVSLFESVYGMNYWNYISQNPKTLDSFNDVMEADSKLLKLALKDCGQVFGSLDSLVDVGGGIGTVSKLMCQAFPNLKCIVFDLPHVVANLPQTQNLSYVGGDMFQSIPSAHAVLLKWVLHDWSDEECIKILSNCREAISSKGEGRKVIIIDTVIDEKNDSQELTEFKLYHDILMMALVNGRERNEKEWKKLLLEAGFRHYKISHNFGSKSLIEVYP
ncbi:trans-resveratrol di-O-methyltransferase-like [Senna tora]|uniref:Trans-resveratrol di-O-methyltransferase-like n=1 Tax=Senna tora TaxID=362788 RepID=A0A835CFJ0_9FABA|nr:trans-resveratrol di-O-methyltransferase-like [Senna tora]